MADENVVVETPHQDGAGIVTGTIAPPAVAGPGEWQTHIPTEYKAEKLWEPLKEKPLGDVLKGYAESQKLIGGAVKIPGADATPEEKTAFNRKLGVPETADAYDLGPAFKDVPADDPIAKSFRSTAHQSGLTPSQVAAVTGFYQEMLAAGDTRIMQANEQGEKALKAEWGATYDHRASLAARAARQFGGDEIVSVLDGAGIGSHPAVVKMFEKLGREMAEDGAIVSDAQGIVGPRAATTKINEILGNPKHAYWVQDDPGHKAAVAEMTSLQRIKAAGEE